MVLNFWASWCDPCKEEAATLQKASVDYANRGVVFVGVDYLDQEPAALRYLKEYEITYANGPDLASQIARRYRIEGAYPKPSLSGLTARWIGSRSAPCPQANSTTAWIS